MTVHIEPIPAWAEDKRFKPQPQPVFKGKPTPKDIELALALFKELDEASRAWYGEGFEARLRERLEDQ